MEKKEKKEKLGARGTRQEGLRVEKSRKKQKKREREKEANLIQTSSKGLTHSPNRHSLERKKAISLLDSSLRPSANGKSLPAERLFLSELIKNKRRKECRARMERRLLVLHLVSGPRTGPRASLCCLDRAVGLLPCRAVHGPNTTSDNRRLRRCWCVSGFCARA